MPQACPRTSRPSQALEPMTSLLPHTLDQDREPFDDSVRMSWNWGDFYDWDPDQCSRSTAMDIRFFSLLFFLKECTLAFMWQFFILLCAAK